MESNHEYIKLTTAEIGVLWSTYIENTAIRCFYKHFLQHLQDVEIKAIIEETLNLVENNIEKIKSIFEEENIAMPQGFSDNDVDLKAPALYSDLFALSFLYRGGQVIMPYYANVLTKVSRIDIYQIFSEFLYKETELHRKALQLMNVKGLNDRPPKMEYPTTVEFLQHNPSLINTWFGDKRPLNTLEIGELFTAIERNTIGLILLLGFIQVMKDKEIKDYLLKGKKLAERQIETFDKFLRENDNLIGTPMTLEVTNSTISPFSEKLILFFISSSNQVGISSLGYALSLTMRKDLATVWSLFIVDIMKYGGEGIKTLVERGWMESPPQPVDRNKFYKS